MKKPSLTIYERFLSENQCVQVDKICSLLDFDKSIVADWIQSGTLLSVKHQGKLLIPLFQFSDGQPVQGLKDIFRILSINLSPWQIAFWFCTPNAWLGNWREPKGLIATDLESVRRAAEHEVAEKEY